MLGPLARTGYVLRYDMVFVPRQPLRLDLLAPADALPRAVPLDTLVGLANLAVPGWVAQRLALAGLLFAAAVGAGRLVPARRRSTRVVAALGYAWTPLLAERLLLGQWGLLLCYAALPWLVRASRDVRRGRPGATPRLLLAAACASVTPTGGVIAAAVVLILIGRPAWRLVLPVAALNAPWLLATAASAAPGGSDPAGVAAFAARAENWAGPLAALAGTGGIWSAQATPASRAAVVVPLLTAGLLAVAAVGYPRLRARWPEGTGTRLAWLAGGAMLVAAAGTLPGARAALRWAVVEVPGAGLLRDGQKFLIPYALCLALCVALGAERLASLVTARSTATAGRLVLLGAAVLPVAMLPDLAWGAAGRLRPVDYPADWPVVAREVTRAPGPVVSLPFHGYRAYPWNPTTVVRDPTPRYLPAPVLIDDRLRVGPTVVAGEDRRAVAIRTRLVGGDPVADHRVAWVLVHRDVGGAVPATALAGLEKVHDGPSLTLYRNPRYRPDPTAGPGRVLPLVGHLLAAGVLVAAGWHRVRRRPAARRNDKEVFA